MRLRFDADRQWNELVERSPSLGALPRQSVYGTVPGLVPFGEAYPDKLIQPSEYKEVIAECHTAKVFPLYHQAATWCPPGQKWNQNGLPYCTTEDTEVLTQRGWVQWPNCVDSDLLGTVNPVTQRLEFQRPLDRQVFEHKGEVICSTNKRVDFAVTPKHRMYVRKFDHVAGTLKSDYEFVLAEDLGWYVGLMAAPKGFLGTELVEVSVPGDRTYDGDDFLAMLAMIVSDGYAGATENTRNWVSFCCFDERYYDRVAGLAHRVGLHETPGRRGVWVRYDAGALAEWVRANCYTGDGYTARNKRVPDIVKWTSERQIKHFLLWYLDQDRKSPLTMFCSSSHQAVDDLQELLLRIGKRSTPSWSSGQRSVIKSTGTVIQSGEVCRLCVSDTDRLCLDRKKHIEQDHYNGLVYCATVPNGTLVTRRNQRVLISGNCWAWGLAASIMDVRAREGKPTKLLAPVSLGFTVNWANRGNYLESAIRGATERGICEAEYVPDPFSRAYKGYRQGWEQNALLYRLAESWDVDNRSTSAMIQHSISVLSTGTPLYVAYNWWGHALECVGVEWDESVAYNIVWVLRNSHNEADLIRLTGSRGVPSEAYGIRATAA